MGNEIWIRVYSIFGISRRNNTSGDCHSRLSGVIRQHDSGQAGMTNRDKLPGLSRPWATSASPEAGKLVGE